VLLIYFIYILDNPFFHYPALIASEISLSSIGFLKPEMNTPLRIDQVNIVGAATFGSVAATSVTTTFIICRAIYSNTTHGGRCRARYKYIADIVIQSSAIYSTLMLLLFILQLMYLFDLTPGVRMADIFIVSLAFGMTVSSTLKIQLVLLIL